MRIIKKGATSQSIHVWIRDSSSTTGAGLSGLAYNTASLTAYYTRPGSSETAITLATQTVTGAYSSGGFVEIGATNSKGLYRLDLPDAVIASGVDFVSIVLRGAANMEPCVVGIQLVAMDHQDTVRAGLTALPNVASGSAGAIITSGTGTAQLSVTSGVASANVTQFGGSAGTFASGRPEVNTTHAAGTAWGSGAITAASFASDAITAAKVAADVSTEIRDKIIERTCLRGTATTGGTTTSIPTSAMTPATTAADQLKGRIVIFDHDTTTAALRGQATDITASTASATPTLTVTALTTAPASGDTFTIV